MDITYEENLTGDSSADEMGRSTPLSFLPFFLSLSLSLSLQCHLQRSSCPPARTLAMAPRSHIDHPRPRLVVRARVRPRPSVRLSSASVGRIPVVGGRKVSIGGVGSSDQNALHCVKCRKSLSLHHSLQESRHVTQVCKFSTCLLFSLNHHTTLHRHTDWRVVVLWVDQSSRSSLTPLADK